jgi:hypothetical protein
MDRERITAAMDQVWRQFAADRHAPTDPTLPAVIYDPPRAPDVHGFVAIGELQDRGRERTGIVLLHQATGSVRLTWTTDAATRSA